MAIHKTAIISDKAKIADDAQIGPYCIIGEDVEIGSGCILKSHVAIEKNTKMGKNNVFYPFSVIGTDPQDHKFFGEKATIEIGDNNTFREHVTVHIGTENGGWVTKIGNDNLFMVGAHIAHDCIVGNKIVLANNATLAGHVIVEDTVIVGGLSAIHQFTRIGKGAMIGGMSGVATDVVPYTTIAGERANVVGLNLVGIKRKKIERSQVNDLRSYFKEVFQSDDESPFVERVIKCAENHDSNLVKEIVEFVSNDSSRQFCQMKK